MKPELVGSAHEQENGSDDPRSEIEDAQNLDSVDIQ